MMYKKILGFLLSLVLLASLNTSFALGVKIPSSTKKANETIVPKKIITYRVFGKSYHVMNSSKNYEAIGVASWYGRPFHRRYTSSGERYNMFQMTAAHKTLPLPTYLLVTNVINGKKVVVKVNDRGPFVGNRLIDLSYAAAKKLGMVSLGVGQVEIKAIAHPRFVSV
jgi:rare lipoprotein A